MQAASGPQQQMLELEALQLSQSTAIESILPADPASASPADLRRLAEALAAHPRASKALRQALGARPGRSRSAFRVSLTQGTNPVEQLHLDHAVNPRVPPSRHSGRCVSMPTTRRWAPNWTRWAINEATLEVRWEDDLKPGPIGEYIEVDRCRSGEPVLLCAGRSEPSACSDAVRARAFGSQPAVPSADGLCGGHEDDRSLRSALGPRGAVGAAGQYGSCSKPAETDRRINLDFVQRLRIYPHALRAKNAYYSPERKALLLGYFTGLGVGCRKR